MTASKTPRFSPQALLWDNDGVLIETEPLYFRATQEILADIDVELTVEDYQEISLRQGGSCFDLVPDLDTQRLKDLRKVRDRRYEDLIRKGVRVYPFVEECLNAFHGRIPMVVVTSTPRSHFDLAHSQTGFARFFEFVVAQEDTPRHKPDPQPYLTAAQRLGVAPKDCLAIEDTRRGFDATINAQIPCVVVPHGLTQEEDFAGAAAIMESLEELLHGIGPA